MYYSGSQDTAFNWESIRNVAIWGHCGTSDQTQFPQNVIRIGRGMNNLSPKPKYAPLMSLYWGLGHGASVWHDRGYRRPGSPVSGTKATYDWIRWLRKFSTDATNTAIGHVEYAEYTKAFVDYRAALTLVNAMSAGSTKTNLVGRLATLKAQIYARAWVIDFGSTNFPSSGNINNITNINNGVTVNNLVDIDGGASTIGLRIINRFSTWQPQKDFTITLDGTYFAMPTTYNRDGGTVLTSIANARFALANLNPAKTYKIQLTHSMDNGDDLAARSDFKATIGAVSVTQYSQLNTVQTVDFDNLTPSGALEIVCSLASPSGRDSAITGLILIEKV